MSSTTDAEKAFSEANRLAQQKDLAGALRRYREATDLRKDDPRYWIAYGVCLIELRQFEESVRALRKGIALKPHYGEADARLYLAEALLGARKRADARKELEVVAKMKPTYPSHDRPMVEAKRKLVEMGRS
jgi:Flp pilus assembly protein TadD